MPNSGHLWQFLKLLVLKFSENCCGVKTAYLAKSCNFSPMAIWHRGNWCPFPPGNPYLTAKNWKNSRKFSKFSKFLVLKISLFKIFSRSGRFLNFDSSWEMRFFLSWKIWAHFSSRFWISQRIGRVISGWISCFLKVQMNITYMIENIWNFVKLYILQFNIWQKKNSHTNANVWRILFCLT